MKVLRQKVQNEEWKKFLYFKKPFLENIEYSDNLTDKIIKLSYSNAIECNRQILWELVSKLQDYNEHLSLVDLIQVIDSYYIYKNKFYQQIFVTSNQNMYRFFYYPLYTVRKNYVELLLVTMFNKQVEYIYSFDINGAIVRALLMTSYLLTKVKECLQLALIEDDIYKVITPLCNIRDTNNRDEIKRQVITSIFKRDINFFKNIIIRSTLQRVNTYYICRVLNTYIINQIPEFCYLVHFNFDGGYILSSSRISLPLFWNLQTVMY